MSKERPAVLYVPSPLGSRIPQGAGAEQLADVIAAIWLELDQTLHPIIGHRGVAALYNRSLKLSAASHPWLPIAHQADLAAVDPSALRAALGRQTATEAAAGGDAHFAAFHGLLASLVGPALTDRLLHAVWAQPAQDSTS